MNSELLDLEVQFLVLKYGYENVFSSLSKINGLDINSLKSQLSNLELKKSVTASPIKKAYKTELEIAETTIKNAKNYEQLKKLAINYQNKVFLPNLKDIKRLLERNGVGDGKIKSRKLATKLVFTLLMKLDESEIVNLYDESSKSNESAFSLLSNQILGNN